MINNKTDEIGKDKKDIETKNITELNKSFLPDESKDSFTNFSNFENIDFYSPNMDFSDMITSSSKYTQSISDADLLLNELSSKLFQSEGNYSTLLYFFEQMKILVYDQDPNIPNNDTTISLTCKSIIDKTIKLQDENIQMKLSLQKIANAFLKENNPDTKDDSISHYVKLIYDLIKQKDDQNTFNSKISSAASELNKPINNNEERKKIEKMSKIIEDLKKKVEKLKNQKYIFEATIKKIERQIINDKISSSIENNDERYEKIVDEVKKLQEKCQKFSKICNLIQSNFAEDNDACEDDPDKIVKIFSDLKKEINLLRKENSVFSSLLKSSASPIDVENAIKELKSKIGGVENECDNYSSVSKIEEKESVQLSDKL